MGKGSSVPKAPDYAGQTKTAKQLTDSAVRGEKVQNKRAGQQLKHFQTQAIEDRGVVNAANAGLTGAAQRGEDFSASLQDRYKSVFQPLEDDLIKEYHDYSTPGRYDLNRGRAMSDVATQFEGARTNAARELESFGVNPAATRFAALDLGVRTQEAAAKAAAANQADQQTEATARGLRTEALGLGAKLPGYADTSARTGIAARNSVANNTLDATKADAVTTGTGTQWGALGADYLNAGVGANTSAANIEHTGFGDDLSAYNAEQTASSGVGDALGLVAGIGAKAFLGPVAPWTLAAAEGGAIPGPGAVPQGASPSGGRAVDDVNAKLSAGEFVLPEDVTRWLGEKKLQDMILKAREEKSGAEAKPEVSPANAGPTTYVSRPDVGAIPMRG